jgi:hypothetical protein
MFQLLRRANLEKPFQRGWENPLFQLDEDSASVSLLHEGGVFTSSLGEAVASFLFWSKAPESALPAIFVFPSQMNDR